MLTMRSDLFLYLSGPMTAKHGYTIEENVAAGVGVYFALLQRGLPAFCPHLSGAFPSAWTILPHAEWLAYDFAAIDRCTHVVALERWETSTGAVAEVEYARAKGIPVISVAEALDL